MENRLNDTDLFMDAQDIYLSKTSSKRDKEVAWDVMFEKVNKCCNVQIRKWLKKTGQVQNCDRDDMVSEAVFKIMNRYKKKSKKGSFYHIDFLVEVCRLATMGEVFYFLKRKIDPKQAINIGVTGEDFDIALIPDSMKRHIILDNEQIEDE